MAVSEKRILTALDKRIQGLMSGPDAPKELTEEIVTSLVPDIAVDVMAAFRAIKPIIQKAVPSVLKSWRDQSRAVVAGTAQLQPSASDSSSEQLNEPLI